MIRFLIKAALESEALIREQHSAYLRAGAYRRKCGKADVA